MMLQALIEYAERENLGDADFESVDVRWLIPITEDGQMEGGPIPLSKDSASKKPVPLRMPRPFTSPNELNQGTKAHFLCDTLERGLLFLDAKGEEKRDARSVQHRYFQSLFEEASKAVPEMTQELNAVLTFLRDPAVIAVLHAQLKEARAKPTDNVTFRVASKLLLDDPRLKAFWRARRRSQSAAAGSKTQRICIATNQLAETLDTTEKIKGVPGGLATGTNLISFDKDAFCSFGLEQAQNAALSAPAELKIRSSLNHLIETSRSQKLFFNDTIYLHWSRHPVEEDCISLLNEPDPNAVAALLQSVREGSELYAINSNAYYALCLSGNGARVVVRDWLESTVGDIRRSIGEWFEDLALVDQEGTSIERNFKFGALLYAMVRDKLEELPPNTASQLFLGALRGRKWPVSETCLAACLRRLHVDPGDRLNPRRMALIKLCLLRLNRPPSHKIIITEKLDSASTDRAYLCGRLFAVFDRLQYFALGSVNAGVVDRFYASASTTPSLVMGRLFRNAQNHLAKANEGVAENIRKDIESITSSMGSDFPPSLTLEEQGRFALGFYHQKADFRRRTAERAAEKAQLAESTTTNH